RGTVASCSFRVTVLDTVAPVALCPTNIVVTTSPGSCASNVAYNVVATDNCPGQTVICVPASGSVFAKGVATVACTAVDGAGNTNLCAFTVTVRDAEAPVAVCPTNIVVTTSPGSCASNVTFSVVATDNCPGQTVVCLPASGSVFAKGVTTVACTAVDGAGNTNLCAFTVTVRDAEAPMVVCPANIAVATSMGACSSNVTYSVVATDNCPGLTVACVPASGSVFAKGVTTVACTATDAAGNTNRCTFTVSVSDAEVPVASCPANLSVTTSPGSCASNVTFAATSADNCPGQTVACVPPSGSVFAKGVTTVACTATDAVGNTNRCAFTVTVSDAEAPAISCPANLLVVTSPGSCASNVTFAATSADNCPGQTVACVPPSGSVFAKGVTTVACTVTDAVGNTNRCAFTVTVADAEAPVALCPANLAVTTSPGSCASNVTFLATATDNCPGQVVVCLPPSGSVFAKGVTTVACTATDAVGNTNRCTFTVTVSDAEAPVASCPANLSATTSPGSCASNVTFAATSADNCPGQTVACVPPSGSAFGKGVTTVACTAVDAAGNTNLCMFTVSVTDAETPVPSCPGNLAVHTSPGLCFSNVTFSATTTDNCPGDSIVCVPASGSAFAKGVTMVVCTATDAAGNTNSCAFTVAVTDVEAPVAGCPASIAVSTSPGSCASNVIFSASASDNCAGQAVVCVPASGSAFAQGVTTVACTATDAAGNTNLCMFTVSVTDAETPVTSCPGDLAVNTSAGLCASNVTFTATATDNCPGVGIVCVPASGSAFAKGVTTVACTATDAAGNTNRCAFTVTVTDAEAPMAMCPANVAVTTSPGSCASNVTFTATTTDNCPGDIIVCVPPSGGAFAKGLTTVACTATDAAGNTNRCAFTVMVRDEEAPVAGCPANILVTTSGGSCASNVTFAASATDNCPGQAVVCVPASGSPFAKGLTTVVCTATDAAGNTNTCAFTVTVQDEEAPGVICPPDILVATSVGSCASNVTFAASATDNCPGPAVVCVPASGSPFAKGLTTVVCTATDAAGNTNACAFTVTVRDGEAPAVTCPSDILVATSMGSCASNVTFVALATDNCPGQAVVCVPASGSAFARGVTTVACAATDAAGNVSQCGFQVTVVDQEPPSVACPADRTVPTGVGTCTAPVLFAATVADNCGSASVTCVPASGSLFALGATVVTCVGQDVDGNLAQCAFTVTVEDGELPVILCPTNLVVEAAAGVCFSNVAYAVQAMDACPGLLVACVPPSGTAFQAGLTVVQCTATDGSGNTAACSFSVTVLDLQPPRALCPPTVIVPAAEGCRATQVELLPPTLDDNCAVVALVNDAPAEYPLGITRVTWQATDVGGNTVACTQVVSVVDMDPPTVSYPTNLQANCAGSMPPAGTNGFVVGDTCSLPVSVVLVGQSFMESNAPNRFVLVRTYEVLDAASNAVVVNQFVTVNDMVAPVVACPPSVSATSGQSLDPWENPGLGIPAAWDDCGEPPVLTYQDSLTQGGCPQTIARTWTATDASGNRQTCVQTLTVFCPVLMTDSARYSLLNDNFNLLYSPDQGCYKLNSSVPGQYYFNSFHRGPPGQVVTFTITLPYPWVTQGAQALHLYSGLTHERHPGGVVRLIPGQEVQAEGVVVTLSDYQPQAFGSQRQVVVNARVPATGFLFLTLHLDYGLEGSTGYGRVGRILSDATRCGTSTVLIPASQPYFFGIGGAATGGRTIRSINQFNSAPKKGVLLQQQVWEPTEADR
ncbi:MAG: hypothetical protein RJA22_2809, partial [Verrucomicrobiota bacterium]